jgi:hypothetical protein
MSLRRIAATWVVFLLALVFALDYWVGKEINLWLLYVPPVALSTITLGLYRGMLVGLIATGLLLTNGWAVGYPYSSFALFLFDRLCDGIAYLILAASLNFAGKYLLSPNQFSRLDLGE